MAKKLLIGFIKFFVYIFVILYMFFEEYIWQTIVVKVINKIKEYRLYAKYIEFMKGSNRYFILIIFMILFIASEYLGIFSFVLFAQMKMMLGMFLYIVKLLVATIAFSTLNATKEILCSFIWFNYIYGKLVYFSEWIKNTKTYKNIKHILKVCKRFVKFRFYKLKRYLLDHVF